MRSAKPGNHLKSLGSFLYMGFYCSAVHMWSHTIAHNSFTHSKNFLNKPFEPINDPLIIRHISLNHKRNYSHNIMLLSKLSMIIQVNVVLNRTVVGSDFYIISSVTVIYLPGAQINRLQVALRN